MLKKNHYYAIVLAGGSGTRFWPLSRQSKPKQFLNITGASTLLESTLKRTKIPPRQTFIVTNKAFQKDTEIHAKAFGIPKSNILYEPLGKNTAPAIGWASHVILSLDPEAITAVFPSDHLILNEGEFQNALKKAFQLAGENFLVTFGIKPSRPETGYGYLKTKKVKHEGKVVLSVEKFLEKPDFKKAQELLKTGNHLWNSGMFVWKASEILKAFDLFLPEVSVGLRGANKSSFERIWKSLPDVSIDCGILEKAEKLLAVEASNWGWSDLGSWESVMEVLPTDKAQNNLRGDVVSLKSGKNLVWSHKKTIAVVGLNDLIVIDTPDALLICNKKSSQDVKDIVTYLKERKPHLI